MKTLAPLAFAGFALAACNAPAPQASAPPIPGSVAVTPPGFQLPEGADCSAKIARYRAVQDNDLSMGHVVPSVYNQIKRDVAAAESVCAAGHERRGEGDDRRLGKTSRLSDRSVSERVAQVRGDEHRHPQLVNVAGAAHDVHAGKLGVRVAREMRVDPRLGPRGGDREGHQFHAGDAPIREHDRPAARDRRFAGVDPGLFEQLPPGASLTKQTPSA